MDKQHYEEMASNLSKLIQKNVFRNKKIYLFGHCNATEKLADLLSDRGFYVTAILDNNIAKHGMRYRGIPVERVQKVLTERQGDTIVCIAARAYEAMAEQLAGIGYKGLIYKMTNYDSYAEYSLSEKTVDKMYGRVERGIGILEKIDRKFPDCFLFLCPFSALGDIYLMLSYLPCYMQEQGIGRCLIGVVGNACAEVVRLFGSYHVEVFSQKDMDEMIQAAIYTHAENVFIPHQDRPYVVNLHKALYVKCIPLERIYCCGVFGLPIGTEACEPAVRRCYGGLKDIKQGKSVILSPYAKSVTALPDFVWEQITDSYLEKGYQCFTNVAGGELPLKNTLPISPAILEIQSVVEWAGTFIGIRSGLCDVIRRADCRKVALYPDYNYCDTKWKAIDMYEIAGWENIVVKEGFQWEKK